MEYGKMKSPHFEKNKKLMAISHYGKAKFKSTNFLIDCYKKKKFPAVIVRPYQVYGTHQDVNRLIPFVITNSLANKKYPISAGNQKRDLLFIADFVNGLEKIMYSNKHTNGEIFNIGYGKAVKVKDIVNLITAIIKKGEPEFGKIKLRKEENLATFPNINKIKKTIDWSPKTDLKKGILKTIMYYKKQK